MQEYQVVLQLCKTFASYLDLGWNNTDQHPSSVI